MPTYLNDLSVADPADTEAVSQGAARIRTLTDAAKNTIDVEHTQTGEHQFPVTQPGTPVNGQIWFDLVNKVIRRYDGTNHTQANTIKYDLVYVDTLTALTGSYQTIATLSLTTFVNSRVFLIGNFLCGTGADVGRVEVKFVRDLADVSGRTVTNDIGILTPITGTAFDVDEPTAGTYSYKVQARMTTIVGSGVTSISRTLLIGIIF